MALVELSQVWTDAQTFDDAATIASPVVISVTSAGNSTAITLVDSSNSTLATLDYPASGFTASRSLGFQDASGVLVIRNVTVDLTAQAANISSTNLTSSALPGMYRVTAYLEGTTIGTGTLTVNLAWTDDVGATTDSGLTFLLTGTGRASRTVPLYLASGEISYSTSGYLTGAYALRIRVESLA